MPNECRHRRDRSRSPYSHEHREHARERGKYDRADRTRSKDDSRSRHSEKRNRHGDYRNYNRMDYAHPRHGDRDREASRKDRHHETLRRREREMKDGRNRERDRRDRDVVSDTRREHRESGRRHEQSRVGLDTSGNRHDHPAEALLQEYGGGSGDNSEGNEASKEGPNYQLSGKLTEYTNTYKGVVIKYNEPPEARKPKKRWRLYPFKGDQAMSVLYIHRQSAYLLGRQRHIVDIPVDHPSCSKQHAVLQYRLVDHEKTDNTLVKRVKPYIIDLESANGTYLNNQRIEPRRYYELREKDVLKFGFSSREYVILHEKSDAGATEEENESSGVEGASPGTSK